MPRRLRFDDLSEFRHLYWDGWPEARIARYFRVHKSVVRRILDEHGLPTRSYCDSNRYLAEERSLAMRRAYTAAARAARWRQAVS